MGEFGHFASIGGGLCIDAWGAGPFWIRADDGKLYRFGDSDRFGPYLATKHGDPVKNPYPRERHPFWRAHRIWKRQGRRLDGDKCIWDEPKPQKIRMINKRNAIIVEQGEEDGKVIVVNVGLGADQ